MKKTLMPLFLCLWVLALGSSCGKSVEDAPLPVDDIPTAMKAAFESAPENLKAISDRVIAALGNQQYPAAYKDLETLKIDHEADLTKEQMAVVERAIMTVAF